MKKYVFKGSTKNVQTKRATNMIDETTWQTFKDGQVVDESLVDLVKAHGGEIVEVEVKERVVRECNKPPEEQKKKAIKKRVAKKKD